MVSTIEPSNRQMNKHHIQDDYLLSATNFLWGGQVTSNFTLEELISYKNLVMLFQNVMKSPTPNIGPNSEMVIILLN